MTSRSEVVPRLGGAARIAWEDCVVVAAQTIWGANKHMTRAALDVAGAAFLRALTRVVRSTLGQTPQLAAEGTRSVITRLDGAFAARGALADVGALRDVADAALRGRTVLREISPGIGLLTR